jgi:hypothetical protein
VRGVKGSFLARPTPMTQFYLSLYLFVAAVYLLSASGRIGLSDGVAMFNVTESIVHEGSLSSEPCVPELPGHPNHCVLGVNGRHYAGFGLVPSLLAVPAVVFGGLSATFLHVDALIISRVGVSIFTALISPVTCVVLAMWIVKLGYSRRTAAIGAFILAFASPFWHFSVKGFYSEPYSTLALLLAAYLLLNPEVPLAVGLSGFAFGAACGCRVNSVILFPCFLLSLAVHIRARGFTAAKFLREAALFTAAFSICAFLIGVANYTRFGSPWKTGYHLAYPSASALLSTPLFHGVYGLLFSGDVGLLVFAPWVLVALIGFPSFVRAHLPEGVLCGTLFLVNLLFFAKYDSWHGGWVAGPRFLTPTLPFFVMAMVPFVESLRHPDAAAQRPLAWATLRTVMMILLIAGTLIQTLGVVFPEERYYALMAFYGNTRPKPWWAGSIPLASVDFIPRAVITNPQSVRLVESADRDQQTLSVEETQAWATLSTAKTEEDFLRSFPNSENLVLPNLMLFKMKLLGLPTAAVCGYGVSALFLGLIGLMGLKRYAAPSPG